MDVLADELGRSLPSGADALRAAIRLLAAILAGTVIGLQRERSGKPAGLRTHMLVCFGTALLVIGCAQSGMGEDAMSRVIQGVITGIGFLGAGAILKREGAREILGLTTAAGIWLTAALGIVIGLGHLGTAALGVLFAWFVLAFVRTLEERFEGRDDAPERRDS